MLRVIETDGGCLASFIRYGDLNGVHGFWSCATFYALLKLRGLDRGILGHTSTKVINR